MHLQLTFMTCFGGRGRQGVFLRIIKKKNHFALFIYLNHVTMFIVTEISKNKDPDKKF